MKYELQTTPSRSAVWVHCDDGSTVGRFGRAGIDIHTSITEQLAGASQCKLCGPHTSKGPETWELFRTKAKELWNIDVPFDAFDIDQIIIYEK
jgi:hypothetical protein